MDINWQKWACLNKIVTTETAHTYALNNQLSLRRNLIYVLKKGKQRAKHRLSKYNLTCLTGGGYMHMAWIQSRLVLEYRHVCTATSLTQQTLWPCGSCARVSVWYFRPFNNVFSTPHITIIQSRTWLNENYVIGKRVERRKGTARHRHTTGLRVEPGTYRLQVYNVTAKIARSMKHKVPIWMENFMKEDLRRPRLKWKDIRRDSSWLLNIRGRRGSAEDRNIWRRPTEEARARRQQSRHWRRKRIS
jgi:endogenous inhibitor of DNA gyrase (YacG/DUF329 family)